MKSQKSFQWKKAAPAIAGFFSLVGVILYAVLSWGHAHGQVSVIDEGLYLYKGLLFASGEYRPFQDFGPLTNHMPLSFLIPGFILGLFDPGIRTGRMMAIALGILMLIGLWLVTKRLAGNWWATAAIWAIAMNSALIKIYSQAVSQVMVACLLVWVLVLVAGRERPQWQVLLGVLIASVLFFTRINMGLVLPIVIAYIFWEHGKKLGFIALLLGSTAVIIGHSVLWPDILKLWAKWIPEAVSPFLNAYRLPSDAIPYWNPDIAMVSRIDSLRITLQTHFVPLIGFLGTLVILTMKKSQRSSARDDRSTWLVVSLFGFLFLAHASASLGLNYCVYCLRNYLAFFSPTGLILLGIFGRQTASSGSPARSWLIMISLLITPFLLGFPLGSRLPETLLDTDVTRISALSLQPGTQDLGVLLENKIGLTEEAIASLGQYLIYAMLILVPLIAVVVNRFVARRYHQASEFSAGSLIPGMAALLVLEMMMANLYFSNGYHDFDCGEDIIKSNEVVGEYLERKVPEGSTIYWGVGRSPVSLLYLPDRRVFPSQLNGDYTYMLSGDSRVLERFGYWDSQLAESWLNEANYVLVEERSYSQLFSFGFNRDRYDEITRTPPTDPCRSDSAIMIFRNLDEIE